jgi:fido (protein-threonine AMPylation protein)
MPADDQDELFPGFAAFRDDEDSPFYRSLSPAFGTPQKTTAEITARLSRVILEVLSTAERSPLRMGLEDLLRWHRAIFITTFPYQAGTLRTAQTQFGVRWREGGELRTPLVTGSEPRAVRAELGLAFAAYDAERERCARPERSLERAAMAAGRLYADILRIHPFDDGNLRGALPALQAALVSLGAPTVHFEAAVAEHDEALGWALRPDAQSRTIEPFAELLLSRIRASGNPATEE